MARMLRELLSRFDAEEPATPQSSADCPCCYECLAPGEDTDRALVSAFVVGQLARRERAGNVLCAKHGALALEAARFVAAGMRR